MTEPNTVAPLYQWLFGLGLLLLVIWLLDRAFPPKRSDDVQRLIDERKDRARQSVRDC